MAMLLGFGFAVAFGLLGLIGPVSFGRDAPAWVQAIGSVAAIIAAVAVPAWQRSLYRKERHHDQLTQAKITAGVLQPLIHAYRRRAAILASCIAEAESVKELKGAIPIDAFDLAPTLQQFHPSFHYLGETGELANRFVANLFWLQQGMQAIHHNSFGPQTRAQIAKDCANAVALALELSPALEAMCGKPNRLPDAAKD